MPVALIVQLITTFGPGAVQLITALIAKWETNGNVTSAEWASLIASLQVNAQAEAQAVVAANPGANPALVQAVTELTKG